MSNPADFANGAVIFEAQKPDQLVQIVGLIEGPDTLDQRLGPAPSKCRLDQIGRLFRYLCLAHRVFRSAAHSLALMQENLA